ncbi:hypothetical protein [Cystobacter ferrugineus]|uniref:Uncharacterized protein n=1 Tax=Cystobacter ferrugineus TaxID=83449 RepID=A0A1L9BIU6_9BACT|nr:hypothetical protein [Cystobacter ferrugineus]OJH42177.1 hypothetical protein BON30_02890 [Cystobacter ferrugineus]
MTLAIAGFARFPPELLLVLAVSLLLWPPVHRLLLRLTTWCFDWGAFRAALALIQVLERLPLAAWMSSLLWNDSFDTFYGHHSTVVLVTSLGPPLNGYVALPLPLLAPSEREREGKPRNDLRCASVHLSRPGPGPWSRSF